MIFDQTLHDNLGGHVHPSINATKYMTFGLLAFTLTIGILVPKGMVSRSFSLYSYKFFSYF